MLNACRVKRTLISTRYGLPDSIWLCTLDSQKINKHFLCNIHVTTRRDIAVNHFQFLYYSSRQ